MSKKEFSVPWFVDGDIDGFFGLFIDNLLQLMLVIVLCRYSCGFPAEFVTGRILPGAAISILSGNIFYTWQARQLARKEGRKNVTALPFGINTVSLLAFVFLVMSPVYNETGDSELAWKVGLVACFMSGIIECSGAFVGKWIKKHTPRAALLSGLGGVALSFMALGFSFQIFSAPSLAIVPAFLIAIFYAARIRLPFHFPAGVFAVGLGVGAAWILKWTGLGHPVFFTDSIGLHLHIPIPAIREIFSVFLNHSSWAYIAVVFPMGFFNVIASIQNLESAEAAGDEFEPKSSLLVNGLTSMVAALFGSPFPTSIYIGHPGWKSMGARTGYSLLNGLAIAGLCFIGGITAILKVVPIETTLGILIWIGLVLVAQVFTESDKKHSIAVAIGFIPPLAAWVLHIVETTLRAAGSNLYEAVDQFRGELFIEGIISLYQGFLLTSIIFSAIFASVLDREFIKAAIWCFIAALLSNFGLIHAYDLTPTGLQNSFGWMKAPWFVLSYASIGVILLIVRHLPQKEDLH